MLGKLSHLACHILTHLATMDQFNHAANVLQDAIPTVKRVYVLKRLKTEHTISINTAEDYMRSFMATSHCYL